MHFLPLITTLFASIAAAQSSSSSSTSTSTTTSATSAATVAAGTNGYTYSGCYNETTGVSGTGGARALAGGKMSANETTTVQNCISYCKSSSYQYAGLQYGDECWCAPYLNSLSAKLNESSCDVPCAGNDTELCGGSLTISLYNVSSSGSGDGDKTSAGSVTCGAGWGVMVGAGVLAAAVAVVL